MGQDMRVAEVVGPYAGLASKTQESETRSGHPIIGRPETWSRSEGMNDERVILSVPSRCHPNVFPRMRFSFVLRSVRGSVPASFGSRSDIGSI
jgi:hypothetical protein